MLVQQSRLGEITRGELAEVDHRRVGRPRPEAARARAPGSRRWLSRAAAAAATAERPRPGRRASDPPGKAKIPTDPARTAALAVLQAVRVDNAYANLALPAALREHALSGRDAAFATELVSGTLRMRGHLRRGAGRLRGPLAAARSRPRSSTRCAWARTSCSRCGCPPHAAISTTVDLVRARVGAGAAAFTNAVLRKVSEHDLETWVDRVAPDPAKDPSGHAASRTRHPRWVVDELRKAVGADELDDLLAADNLPPRVTLVARPGRATPAELPGEPTAYSPYGVVLEGGDPGAVAAVAEGRAGVQDEGSQLVAVALAAAPLEGSDRTWLDLCAGPGGKASLLAAIAAERGAGLVASERQPHRARLVARALRGSDGVLGVVAADGVRPPYRPGVLRPGPGRRAVHRSGRAAATSRGALAAQARRPARAGAAPARAGRRRARRWSVPAAWCSTRPARRCSPRPRAWCARCSPGATT